MEELKKELKQAEDYIKTLKTDIHILELEHIQDSVALYHSYGVTIKESLTKMGRMDLYEWLTDKDTGLNTKEYPLGHALNKRYEQMSYENQVAIESNDIGW